jgi:hypothetical protein
VTRAWRRSWFDTGVRNRTTVLWRGVEAQHIVATMRLVDNLEEQRILEDLLESSKPPLPAQAKDRHYLIFTPFRYRSPVGSRFRRPHDAGVWYGAEELATACGEVAYWKWRFLMDSEALAGRALHTEHTFFQARVRGRCADLTLTPWKAAASAWRHKDDFSECRSFADEARARGLAWLRYTAVRVPEGICGAALKPDALAITEPLEQQTWVCKTTAGGAYLQRAGLAERYEFAAQSWK